jgi:acylphosphatase
MSGSTVARRVVLDGRVQGVWFRQSCVEEANAAGVTGWVRNRTDGSVEVWLEGPAPAVDRLTQWCRTGPPLAAVTSVEVEERPPEGYRDFRAVS